MKKYNFFPADLIFCQNTYTKDMYEKLVDNKSSKIIAVGTFRMDNYLKKINSKYEKNNSEKNIVFFSFTRNTE